MNDIIKAAEEQSSESASSKGESSKSPTKNIPSKERPSAGGSSEAGSSTKQQSEKLSLAHRPKPGSKAPETPANKHTGAKEPQAPVKATNEGFQTFLDRLTSVPFKGWTGTSAFNAKLEKAWENLKDDDEASYDALFAVPEGFVERLSKLRKGWQFFPATEDGVGEGEHHKDLKYFVATSPPPSPSTPSKQPKGPKRGQ